MADESLAEPKISEDFLLSGVEESDQQLGRGAYGVVSLGWWHGRKVAVKRLHPVLVRDEFGRRSNLFRRFLHESLLLRRLAHPSIVQVYGMVDASARELHEVDLRGMTTDPGLVMEYLPLTLRQRYAMDPGLSAIEQVSVAVAVASGLAFLHARQVIHRDLTTNNIMVVESSDIGGIRVKITDVGGARVLHGSRHELENMSLNPGTQAYMAPETLVVSADSTSTAQYGRPADCFSLGVVVLAMCLQREPPNLFELARHGRDGDVAALKRGHPLRKIVVQCLLEDPGQRPTAEVLCQDMLSIRAQVSADTDLPLADAEGKSELVEALLTESREQCEQLRHRLRGLERDRDQLVARRNDAVSERDSYIASNQQLQQQVKSLQEGIIAQSQEVDIARSAADSGSEVRGEVARCMRLFAVADDWPDLPVSPKWRQWKTIPDDADRLCRLPCVHDGYLYCAVGWTSDSPEIARLLRIPIDKVAEGRWCGVGLPAGRWHRYSYFVSLAGRLTAILLPTVRDAKFTIFSADTSGGDALQWQQITILPESKFGFGVAASGHYLWVIGGRSGPNNRDNFSHSALQLTVADTICWDRLPDVPINCVVPRIVLNRGLLHLIGYGSDRETDCTTVLSMDVNHPGSAGWRTDALPPIPHQWCGTVVMNGRLVVVGGQSPRDGPVNEVHMYVGECDAWLPLPRLHERHCDAHCFSHGNRLYVLSGRCQQDTLKTVEILSLSE